MLSEEKMQEVMASVPPDANLYQYARAIEAAVLAEQAKSSADRDEAYDLIDRQLRNTLDDADYADYSAALDSLYLHPSPAPEGMVLVPREPTEEMLKAAYERVCFDIEDSYLDMGRPIWEAMIAAAEKEAGK